jgi:transposase
MVWAAIGTDFMASPLIIMPKNKKGTYASTEYTATLEDGLLPFLERPEEAIFQQDNASIHTSSHTMTWFSENGITVHVGWPPYSPDLNCIEHLWPHLKERLYELCPELLLPYMTKTQQSKLLERWLPMAWDEIMYLREPCLASMPDRVSAVITAQGWYTRY